MSRYDTWSDPVDEVIPKMKSCVSDPVAVRIFRRAEGVNMTNLDETLKQRGQQHGDFSDHAAVTQSLKLVLHGGNNWDDLPSTHKEALEMIAHKIGRILSGDYNHPDHWLDIEGYSRITRERLPVAHAPADETPATHSARVELHVGDEFAVFTPGGGSLFRVELGGARYIGGAR